MKAKVWLISWGMTVICILCMIGIVNYQIDPFFHYHKPNTEKYYFILDNERSQNDGIVKHFEYDALITGTSMTENFLTSEADMLFGLHFVKVPFSGGSFKEVNGIVETALRYNPNIKMVIRGLDMGWTNFFEADAMRFDLGEYPTYLYDHNLFNDVKYLLNASTVKRVVKMLYSTVQSNYKAGITEFDDYARWQEGVGIRFGVKEVCKEGLEIKGADAQKVLTDEEKALMRKAVTQNVVSIAERYPSVEFYYFFPPYSIVSWNTYKEQGEIQKYVDAEQYMIELLVSHQNIHLFSFNNRFDIITDLNNYKDSAHYGSWINSLILKWMKETKYQLTENNYRDYIQDEYDFYSCYNYGEILDQPDYEADLYAAALLNEELTGAEPLFIDEHADVVVDSTKFVTIIGKQNFFSLSTEHDKGYNYCVFKAVSTEGDISEVIVTDVLGEELQHVELIRDGEQHLYVIDFSRLVPEVEILFKQDKCFYSDIRLY